MGGPAPSPPRVRRTPWSWIGLGFGLLACGGPCAIGVLLVVSTPGGITNLGASPPPPVQLEHFRQTLGRVRASARTAPASADVPCPDPLILGAAKSSVTTGVHGEARLRVTHVTYEALADFVDKGPTTPPRPGPSLRFSREDLGLAPVPDRSPEDWQWLEDGALAVVFHPNLYEGYYREDSLRSTMRDVLGARYLAVLRASKRSMPRIIDGGVKLGVLGQRRELRSGESFTPGGFQGAVLVMDVDAGSIVCQATIDAHSSASIEYRTRSGLLGMSQQPSQVLLSDFKGNFRGAAGVSLKRISAVVESW
jgi:hypothetical protein